ncbi:MULTISPECIES: class I SAM-dependent methyltransferase [unclassified Pseudomonas]|uniref:Methyltransferase n=1 Tax=Pseudomonas sp. Hg7Tf TaxID=3236988 RepID=A0AB39HUU2_9PSED|nr:MULTISPECIES: class I SAM-dependent methyltransferase [unclassified Pseudomonas]KJK05659.1 SAM-dependent methyltransferase [Pseudomonas sp. 5]MDH2559226.1 class I SAM-dependent methyltransferase [Pseudomonas sp. Hg5Tf]
MSRGVESILQDVNSYYSSKIKDFGATAQGVDWNGSVSQQLRFEQLLKIVPPEIRQQGFSLNDIGCGYGALLSHIKQQDMSVDYYGFDLSVAMIEAALEQHGNVSGAQFEVADSCSRVADYSLASGIFNVCQDTAREDWEAYVRTVLESMNACSRKGFSFNCLTSYSDLEYMRDYLYYGDPCFYFDYCKRTFSGQVALLHDYGLYEFTLLVRKAV